jgi:hypothetical protein
MAAESVLPMKMRKNNNVISKYYYKDDTIKGTGKDMPLW